VKRIAQLRDELHHHNYLSRRGSSGYFRSGIRQAHKRTPNAGVRTCHSPRWTALLDGRGGRRLTASDCRTQTADAVD
jgi:hypothetical protein